MTQGDVEEVVSLFTEAFADSALYCYISPDRSERLDMIRSVFRFRFQGILENAVADLALENGVIAGMAAWDPPGDAIVDIGGAAQRLNEALNGFPAKSLRRWEKFHRILFSSFARIMPPYWDLGPIAVKPDFQGKGVGSILIRKQLAVIDAEKLPAILGTQDRRNLDIYGRFGFKTVSRDFVEEPNLFTYVMVRA
jgi:GNAT superfamily N-acetyltransferase